MVSFKTIKSRLFKICEMAIIAGSLVFLPIHLTEAQKIPKAKSSQTVEVEKGLYPGYPLNFDGIGYLDGIYNQRLVISDGSIILAPGATFNRPNDLNSGVSSFRVGDTIGFLLDSNGRIKSIWLIKKNTKE